MNVALRGALSHALHIITGLVRIVRARRQQRAAVVVEDHLTGGIERRDVQQHHPARPPARRARAPLGHHRRRRPQRHPEMHRAGSKPPVEQIPQHAAARPGRLPNRHIAHQHRMRQHRLRARHLAAQRLVQRQPKPIPHDRLMKRGVRGRERQPRRVEHVAHPEILVVRRTIERLCRRFRPARERQQPLGVRAHRLIHHRAVHPHRSVATPGTRRERIGHRARPAQLALGRSKRAVQDLYLLRMDRPLTVKPQLPSSPRRARQPQRLPQPQKRPVDRLKPRCARRRQHRFLVIQPAVDISLGPAPPERRSQIRVAEDQRLELRRRPGDRGRRLDPLRRLDQSLQADPVAKQRGDPREDIRTVDLRDNHRHTTTPT